jgi:predicted DsbA family dithiol-disulfide isomerase
MTKPIKIDFVSDVSCPWCIVGLKSLEQALADASDAVTATIHFQPFELNPQMAPEGEDMAEHITRKYGSTPEQRAQSREMLRQRGASVGFQFEMDKYDRIWNTFDAHRLLHWAEGEGLQSELKHALFDSYFTRGESPASHEVLLRVATAVGLDPARAADVLASNEFSGEVREKEDFYKRAGISSVPAIIINERYLISGGQTPDVFERELRRIAAEEQAA